MSETSMDNLPTPVEFFLKVPLYKEYTLLHKNPDQVWDVEYFTDTMDAYCPQCKAESIFAGVPKQRQQRPAGIFEVPDHLFAVVLRCTRNSSHELFYLFKVCGQSVQKIGQFPSLADLSLYDVKKYSAILGEERCREFTRAVGLAAHGIGVGSFVYLRRIFEFLVEEAHVLAQGDPEWNNEKFRSSRMTEKIQLLKSHLPDFLVQNHKLYGILSKGLHELTEDECLQAFPVVKFGIESILDAKLEDIQKAKKLKETEKAIQNLTESISQS